MNQNFRQRTVINEGAPKKFQFQFKIENACDARLTAEERQRDNDNDKDDNEADG